MINIKQYYVDSIQNGLTKDETEPQSLLGVALTPALVYYLHHPTKIPVQHCRQELIRYNKFNQALLSVAEPQFTHEIPFCHTLKYFHYVMPMHCTYDYASFKVTPWIALPKTVRKPYDSTTIKKNGS